MPTKIFEAYKTVGKDRVKFGTYMPFHHPVVEIQEVLIDGVSQEGIERIFYENEKIFSCK